MPIQNKPGMAALARWALTAGLLVGSSRDAVADDGGPNVSTALKNQFSSQVAPLLNKYCLRCHNPDEMMSGIRVDRLTGDLEDRQLFLWKNIQRQLAEKMMPPDDEAQPTDQERRALERWIAAALQAARQRKQPKNGAVRRLTVAQYRHTLRDLLGIDEELTGVLPADGLSKDGFLNNQDTLLLSPLLLDAYFDIAERALDACLVDVDSKPQIQSFRVELGESINAAPCPDKLILGAQSALLANQDVLVTQLTPDKPFEFQPFRMRTRYRFVEGYQGNDTVRGWREYDSIYHAVFACVRGSPGYPRGLAYETVPEGLLLRPAIPSTELFGQSSTYGPRANFKISLRELPESGRFRVTVRAARYDDGLLLEKGATPRASERSIETSTDAWKAAGSDRVTIRSAGVYQVDVTCQRGAKSEMLSLSLGTRRFSGRLHVAHKKGESHPSPYLLVKLPAGPLEVKAQLNGKFEPIERIALTRLPADSPMVRTLDTFLQRSAILGVHLGLRRDCGSTLDRVAAPQAVSSSEMQDFVFSGTISNFPSPDVEKDNVNYLAGIREIGVRSEYTDGRDRPRLVIRSVDFEGPYYQTWPPRTHRRIMLGCDGRKDPEGDARRVIRRFASRAYRRPIGDAEFARLLEVWRASRESGADFRQSVKDALLVVLTSPQFLFLIESSGGPQARGWTATSWRPSCPTFCGTPRPIRRCSGARPTARWEPRWKAKAPDDRRRPFPAVRRCVCCRVAGAREIRRLGSRRPTASPVDSRCQEGAAQRACAIPGALDSQRSPVAGADRFGLHRRQ